MDSLIRVRYAEFPAKCGDSGIQKVLDPAETDSVSVDGACSEPFSRVISLQKGKIQGKLTDHLKSSGRETVYLAELRKFMRPA